MSGDQERKYGTPVDEFVKKGQQDNQIRQFNEVIENLNYGLKHITENFGGKISISVDESKGYPQLVGSVEFPDPKEPTNG